MKAWAFYGGYKVKMVINKVIVPNELLSDMRTFGTYLTLIKSVHEVNVLVGI